MQGASESLVVFIKSRLTYVPQCLNHLMLLHVHRHRTDKINFLNVANDFICGNDHRKQFFGTNFKMSDLGRPESEPLPSSSAATSI